MSERGVFGTDRGVFKHEVLTGPFCEGFAWLWICGEASWKPRRIRVGSSVVTLARGQLCHSLRFMGEAWGWNRMKVSRFLDKLAANGMIAVDVVTGQTLITVCNYSHYQRVSLPSCDSTVTGPGQDRDEREPRETNENNPVDGGGRETAFPAHWAFGELELAAAIQEGLPAPRAEPEFRRFRDRQLAKGARSCDWMASWRSWCSSPYRDAGPTGRDVRAPPAAAAPTGRAARLMKLAEMEARPDAALRPDDQLLLPAPGGGNASGGRHYREVPYQSGSGGRPPDEILRAAGLGAFNPRQAAAHRRAKSHH